jgi:hypothetical protein
LVGWAFTLGGLFMAVICALNCLGLARGRLRNDVGLSFNLGLGMVSAGLAGFFWDIGFTDGPVETWRFYWLDLGAFGLVLMLVSAARESGKAPAFWRWIRQGARIHTNRSEWRPKPFWLLGIIAVWFFALGFVPDDNWWFWVLFLALMGLLDALKILPIHRGRRPPKPLGSSGP